MRTARLCLVVALAIATRGAQAAPQTPVIVELFTSEGCSDCPAADKLLDQLVATQPVPGASIIALGQHVDYWDRLGWKDRFSSAAVTRRQQQYQTRFNTDSIYTPQMVVDGRSEFVGSDAAAARKAIEKTLTAPHGRMTIEIAAVGAELAPPLHPLAPPARAEQARPLRVSVSAADLRIGRGNRADIIVMVTERGLTTQVKSGENHGRTLSHAPVVRYLATIGQIAGESVTSGSAHAEIALASDWQRDRLAVVAFAQEVKSRTILGAASVPLK